MRHSWLIVRLLALGSFSSAWQESSGLDWPYWRGPDRTGISRETGWKARWSTEPLVAWRAKVGTGFSSFAVAGGRAFTTGNASDMDTVFCFDAGTGKELWKYSYPADLGDKYFEGGTAATPTVDGSHLFTLSRWGDLFCFDASNGRIIWSKNVQKETRAPIPDWGFSGSPVVHENLVLLNVGESGLALEKATGKTVWKSANRDSGYSTPFPMRRDSRWIMLIGSGQAYLAVDILTGREIWRVKWVTEYGVNAADPIVHGDQIFISSGYNKGAALLKWTGAEPETIWKSKVMRNQINSSVLLDGNLFGIDGDTERAALKCVDWATGAEKWSERSVGAGALMAADGKLIVLSERGELLIAPASASGFKPSGRMQVFGGKSWTAPVLANGRVYCRNSRGDLACVDLRQGE